MTQSGYCLHCGDFTTLVEHSVCEVCKEAASNDFKKFVANNKCDRCNGSLNEHAMFYVDQFDDPRGTVICAACQTQRDYIL